MHPLRALVVFATLALAPVNGQVVISQVYGGGGNSGAQYSNDFIELFNRGNAAVSLSGWSLQYTSATGTGLFGANDTLITELPAVTLQPGQYFLIQEAPGSGAAAPLVADYTDSTPINMSAMGGKVALVNTATPLGCNGVQTACPSAALAQIVDLVGYGAANFFEGSAATAAPSNTRAVLRNSNGCVDTGNNSADFTVLGPNPRNAAATANLCSGGISQISGVGTANPATLVPGDTTLFAVAVTPGANPPSTGITVQADLTSIGGAAAQSFFDNGQGGDAVAGDNIFSYQASVPVVTNLGNKTLPFAIADTQLRTATGSITLAVSAPVTTTTIHDVQGPGNTSPFAGQTVRVSGVVTGLRGNGFYIQTKPGSEDADPATSEGIFVFTGSGNVPSSAALGNELQVTGLVSEFVSNSFPSYTAPPGSATLTELVAPLTYSLLSTGNQLPGAKVIDSSVLSATAGSVASRWSQLEPFEGMRVTLSNFVVTQNTNAVTIFGALSTAATAYREAGVLANKLPTGTPATVPVYDANPEVIRIEGNGLNGGNASFDLPSGSTISSIIGILDYSTGDGIYSIRTNAAGVATQTPASFAATPVPAPLATDFTVATTNVENFSASDQLKLAKVALAIRNVLRSPDVIALQEVNTLASLQALAARIDQDATTAGQTPPNYSAALLPGNAFGTVGSNNTQNVGFLYKPSKLTAVSGVSQFDTQDNTYTNPIANSTELTFDRPPLVISGIAKLPGSDSGVPFTVVANHLKSLIDVDNATNDPNDSGLRNQTKRHFEARDTELLLSQLNAPGVNLVSVGDHNAYQFSDGYVDILNCLKGTPPPANALIYQPPPGQACIGLAPENQLINLTDLDSTARYSYYYLGSRQTLDHILVNKLANSRLRTYATSNLNADFPADGALSNDPSRPERYTDHNPQVAYFTLPNEITSKVQVLASGLIYNRALAAFTGTITVRNTSTSTLSGPLHVFFRNLPAGVALTNATGESNGVPYIRINTALAPGQSSVAFAVRFAATPSTRVTYTAQVYSITF